jgi:hypothetical protein
MAASAVNNRLSALELALDQLKTRLDSPKSEGEPVTVAVSQETTRASSGPELLPAPLFGDPHEGDGLGAFSMVPEEYRNNLRAYFETSPGKYALGRFLDGLSEWWQTNGRFQVGPTSQYHNLAGRWKDDPTWQELTKIIEDNDK